jgi:hypothetical protein
VPPEIIGPGDKTISKTFFKRMIVVYITSHIGENVTDTNKP